MPALLGNPDGCHHHSAMHGCEVLSRTHETAAYLVLHGQPGAQHLADGPDAELAMVSGYAGVQSQLEGEHGGRVADVPHEHPAASGTRPADRQRRLARISSSAMMLLEARLLASVLACSCAVRLDSSERESRAVLSLHRPCATPRMRGTSSCTDAQTPAHI